MNQKSFPIGSYAVIFVSKLRDEHKDEYYKMAEIMVELAQTMDGFLGIDSSARNQDLEGITVSYWRDLESIHIWRTQSDHLVAQRLGKRDFYKFYHLEVSQIVKSYDFSL